MRNGVGEVRWHEVKSLDRFPKHKAFIIDLLIVYAEEKK